MHVKIPSFFWRSDNVALVRKDLRYGCGYGALRVTRGITNAMVLPRGGITWTPIPQARSFKILATLAHIRLSLGRIWL
jgi:hypothetical protein